MKQVHAAPGCGDAGLDGLGAHPWLMTERHPTPGRPPPEPPTDPVPPELPPFEPAPGEPEPPAPPQTSY
jgi:hypothetical protein